jgi:hypothetical protein
MNKGKEELLAELPDVADRATEIVMGFSDKDNINGFILAGLIESLSVGYEAGHKAATTWIKCSERMPEVGDEIRLAYHSNKRKKWLYCNGIVRKINGDFWLRPQDDYRFTF